MQRIHLHSFVGLLVGLVLLSAWTAGAQIVKSTIAGTVSDSSGAVVPGVTVTITNVKTGVERVAHTNEAGVYTMPFLDSGEYRVMAQLAGFKTAVEPKAVLDVAATLRVNLTLQVGQTSETVEVQAATPLVETDTTTLGMAIEAQDIVRLPLLEGNSQELALLSPTAVEPLASNPTTQLMQGDSVGNYYQVAGQRGAHNSYTIDGVGVQQPYVQTQSIIPPIDTIQQFKLQSHNFSAEFGRGSVQFTTTTKPGTNEFHGSLYEYLRNDRTDALGYFDRGIKTPYRRNRYGLTLGGPVIIPKVHNGKNKTFFFYGYQGNRFRQSEVDYGNFPDPRWLTGDFSVGGWRIIYDPNTTRAAGASFSRDSFPNNQIPDGRISRFARAAAKYIPAPNAPGVRPGSNAIGTIRTMSNVDFWTARVDHYFSQKDSFYARYMQSIEDRLQTSLVPLSGQTNGNWGRNAMLAETHSFSANIINEFRLGYNRGWYNMLQEGGLGKIDYAQDEFGLKNLSGNPLTYGIPRIVFSGYLTMGGSGNAPISPLSNTWQLSDNLIINKGRHSMKGGVELRNERFNIIYGNNVRGNLDFNGQFTAFPGRTSTTGNPFGDLLLGLSDRASAMGGGAEGVFHETLYSGYFQDDWRATQKLSLNLGVRYEYYAPWTEENGKAVRIDLGAPAGSCFGNCPPLRIVKSEPGKGYYNPDRNNFAPRVGLAYSPFGGNRTVIRAAYGIFYAPPIATQQVNNMRNPPTSFNFVKIPDHPVTDITTTQVDNLFPPPVFSPGEGLTLEGIQKGQRDQIIQQWQLTLQREALSNLLFEFGYVGSHGYNLELKRDVNQARLDLPGLTTSLSARRPYPAYGRISTAENIAHNSYHAGTLRVQKRMRGDLSLNLAYTFSKTIDNYGNLNDPGGLMPQNSYDLKAEKALSSIHAPHRLTASYVWNIPVGRAKAQRRRFLSNMHPILNGFIGGWQLSGVTTFQSGTPFTIRSSSDASNTGLTGTNAQRVNWAKPGPVKYDDDPRTTGRWFDYSYFAMPASGTFGNASRNVVMGPGINNWNLTLSKQFALREKVTLSIRGESYNAFHHTQFLAVDRDVSPTRALSLLGRVLSARAPRRSQFAVRIEF